MTQRALDADRPQLTRRSEESGNADDRVGMFALLVWSFEVLNRLHYSSSNWYNFRVLGHYNSAPTYRINHDWTVTPRLLVHFGLGWNGQDVLLGSPTENYDPQKELGLNGHTLASRFPRIDMGAFPTAALGGMNSLGPATFNEKYYERRPSGNVSASYVTGRHTFKLGAEYRLEKFPSYPLGGTAGVYTFGSDWTRQTDLQGVSIASGFDGFQLSSFLLGGMSAFSQNAVIAAAASKSQTALYLQDTWKVTRKFDLRLRAAVGLRNLCVGAIREVRLVWNSSRQSLGGWPLGWASVRSDV
jgi:hypothetical protein